MLRFLRGQARNIRGLSTVPGLVALTLWALSLLVLWVDRSYPELASSQPFKIFSTDYETARTVLSTIAAASITTLGLVYSIVLVVFTTAASNIGPRLLQRFTSDSINQATAGLFGGTFLFSLTVLHQTDSAFVPSFSIACTFFLAGLSVLQLIYFVHNASTSVTIDEEIAKISDQLEEAIENLVNQGDDLDEYAQTVPGKSDLVDSVEARSSGYITFIDVPVLVKIGVDNDMFVSLCCGHGDFLVPGSGLARMTRKLEGETRDEIAAKIRDAITTSDSRSPDSDIEFSINLLIEIALRALSPGVNDTFTAVTCIDRISSALVRPVRSGLRDHIRSDSDRVPRVYLPGMTLEDLLNAAFHPLRRASSANVLMTKHILDALSRLYNIGDTDACELIKQHADLVVAGAEQSGLLESDLKFVQMRRKELFQSSTAS